MDKSGPARDCPPTASRNSLSELLEGYRLIAASEGKSQATIDIVASSVNCFLVFLASNGMSLDANDIGTSEIRCFSVWLRQRQRYVNHPHTPRQPDLLSGHTVNGYLRGTSALFACLAREGLITGNPFTGFKIPKAPHKIIAVFTEEQLRRIIKAIDLTSPTGYRDYLIIILLLDTGVRSKELNGLTVTAVNLDSRQIRVIGKGNRERQVPIGAKVQKAIWKYLNQHRPEPAIPRFDNLFLTQDGYPLTKDRLLAIVKRYGEKAGLTGVRLSPHTFRHTMAITFLRNGGDVFSLQRILGHARLETLRIYVEIAQSDVSLAHRRHSPVDNLDFKISRSGNK